MALHPLLEPAPTATTYCADPPTPTPVVAVQHSEAEEEMLALLYAELKPMAVENYINYFLARTPAHLQNDMKALLADDIATPPAPPPPEALVATGETPPSDPAFAPMPAPPPYPAAEPTRY